MIPFEREWKTESVLKNGRKQYPLNPIRQNWAYIIFSVIPILFFIYFYILPLGSIFSTTFSHYSGAESFDWSSEISVIQFTFLQAIASTFFTLLIGLPAAWIFSSYQFPGKKAFSILFTIPFILPTVTVAAAFVTLFAPNGIINQFVRTTGGENITLMNTIWIILLAHVFYNVSVVMRIVGNAWMQIDIRQEEAAKILGASPWQTFCKVKLPVLRSSILSASLLVFLFDFTSYGVILLLGGPAYRTIEVEISQQSLQMMNYTSAGFLAIFQIIISTGIVWWEKHLHKQQKTIRSPQKSVIYKKPNTFVENLAITIVLMVLIVLLLFPMLALTIRSFVIFANEVGRTNLTVGFTLSFYQQLFVNARKSAFFVPPIQAIANSLEIAAMVMLISLFIGLLIVMLQRRFSKVEFLDKLFILPLGTSSVTLGLGYLLFFRENVDNLLILPFVHSMIALPFVIRTLEPALSAIPTNIRDSASVLGASAWQVICRIELPIIKKSIITAGVFSFTISLGEFGATSFLTRPDRPTIPVAIYRYLGQPGVLNYGQAMAMSVILMIICVAAILLSAWFGRKE